MNCRKRQIEMMINEKNGQATAHLKHLEKCRECREFADSMALLKGNQETLHNPEPPARLDSLIKARAREHLPHRPQSLRLRLVQSARLPWAAAALALVMLAIWLLPQGFDKIATTSDRNAPTTSQTAADYGQYDDAIPGAAWMEEFAEDLWVIEAELYADYHDLHDNFFIW